MNFLYFAALRISNPSSSTKAMSENIYDRTMNGILSACLALRQAPIIRYQASSNVCRDLSQKLKDKLHTEYQEYSKEFFKSRSQLILLERKFDPVTPLLTQWTYQVSF
jgi:vacuolar protein sorting-associated protein 45